MNTVTGIVASLQICPGHRKAMQTRQSVEAMAGVGLSGDMHALPESTRQVLLIGSETLASLNLLPGIVKENITTRGISLMTLRPGQRISVGKPVLQLTRPCEPCSRIKEIRAGLSEALRGRRGMLARVVAGGTISIGDAIHPG